MDCVQTLSYRQDIYSEPCSATSSLAPAHPEPHVCNKFVKILYSARTTIWNMNLYTRRELIATIITVIDVEFRSGLLQFRSGLLERELVRTPLHTTFSVFFFLCHFFFFLLSISFCMKSHSSFRQLLAIIISDTGK